MKRAAWLDDALLLTTVAGPVLEEAAKLSGDARVGTWAGLAAVLTFIARRIISRVIAAREARRHPEPPKE